MFWLSKMMKFLVQCRDCRFPSNAKITDKQEFDIQDVPLFMCTFADKSSPIKNLPSKNSVDKFKNSVVECDPNLASGNILPIWFLMLRYQCSDIVCIL